MDTLAHKLVWIWWE